VPGLGERDGVFHRLAIANLADQNHVRGLAQRVLQRRVPALGIHADFALRDDAVAMFVHVLDRIFDGDDVTVAVFVAVADHRGERGGFAGTGRADQHNDAALGERDVLQHRRQIQLVETRNLGGDGTQHHARAALLHEAIHAKTPDAGRTNREVAFAGEREIAHLLVVHDRVRQRFGVLRREALVRNRRDLAVDFQRGRKTGGNEQVGSLARDHCAQQFVHESLCVLFIHDCL
jgi:hypothetical protein